MNTMRVRVTALRCNDAVRRQDALEQQTPQAQHSSAPQHFIVLPRHLRMRCCSRLAVRPAWPDYPSVPCPDSAGRRRQGERMSLLRVTSYGHGRRPESQSCGRPPRRATRRLASCQRVAGQAAESYRVTGALLYGLLSTAWPRDCSASPVLQDPASGVPGADSLARWIVVRSQWMRECQVSGEDWGSSRRARPPSREATPREPHLLGQIVRMPEVP